jgi:two-component system sensor histidine kinase ChvG
VVSVSVPIQIVKAVLGVLTIEAGDVDKIVAAQRAALAPFILIAVAVNGFSSLLLTSLVARPVMRLARAADSVRLNRARILSLPDIAEREDEIGDLTRALEAMTSTLSDRMDATERFAADVSHEIKNPLTSIRSAVETLELSPTAAAQARLLPILKQDVGRLDRLITDISNASRLDAELSRESPRKVDLLRLVSDIAELYRSTQREEEPSVRVQEPPLAEEPFLVVGREGPLGQVLRNLIDNARSFSPPGGSVTLSLTRGAQRAVVVRVEDQGPGVPADNLESIFERFYTQRPRASEERRSSFGGHSGLGLSIARQIVEVHGGVIRAENRLGEGGEILGARFLISLPAAA